MKKRLFVIFLLIVSILGVCACRDPKSNSTFSIYFIDVGQGDSALVECDGHYMLIDGGDTTAGNKVYRVLEEKGVQKLDILAMSHLHADHIGGLEKALTYASSIDITISNADYSNTDVFRRVEHQLSINGSTIKVPQKGEEYNLGSSIVRVLDVSNNENNDSLVLLITYGKTKFLFTGDIEGNAQTRLSEMFENESDSPEKISLMKLPHHGAYTYASYRFLRTFMAENIIISVGKDNPYGHPDRRMEELLTGKAYKPNVYRTDLDGDIIVDSDGKKLEIKTKK